MAAERTELDGPSDEQARAAIAGVMEIVSRIDQLTVEMGHSGVRAQNANRLTMAGYVLGIFIGRACVAGDLPPMQALMAHLEVAVSHLSRAAQAEIADSTQRSTLQ